MVAVTLSFKGRSETVDVNLSQHTAANLFEDARRLYNLESFNIKLIMKGKQLPGNDVSTPLDSLPTPISAGSKVMVMATGQRETHELNEKRSDPTVRSFAQEEKLAKHHAEQQKEKDVSSEWGAAAQQDDEHKFCRFEPVLWQDFGTRPTSKTPHAFEARALMLKLAHDPAIVRIMKEREWRVGLLAELDPIDDRHAEKMEGEGKRLLGYNTNAGAQIHVRLRTEDLGGFLPYPALIDTLLHELAHNEVGPHNEQFWHLFCQLKADYLRTHLALAKRGDLFNGRSGLQLAGAGEEAKDVRSSVLAALQRDRQVPIDQLQVDMLDRYLAASKAMEEVGGNSRGGVADAGQRVGGAPIVQPASAEERRALLAQRASARLGGGASGSAGQATATALKAVTVVEAAAAAAPDRVALELQSASGDHVHDHVDKEAQSEEERSTSVPDVTDA